MIDLKKLKNLRILYVEDEAEVRELLKDILSVRVDKIFIATNGKEGYESYKKDNPDIIITDIKMPIMSGLEMIKEIRKENQDIPIVVTSAFNDVDFLTKSIDLNVDKYITKPVDITKLFDTINRTALVIYQRKELQKKDALLKNKEKVQAIEELLKNISHHWRQPLSVISTSSSAIQLKKSLGILDDEYLEEMCTNINKNAQILSEIIEDFTNFFQNGETQELLNLKDILNKYINMLEPSFKDDNISFVCELEDISLVTTKKDIMQIVFILLNNAKDILILNNIENRYIKISLVQKGDKAILSIQDNANGVPEDIKDKIFEPYFTTKHKSQGTGLGLYVAYEIVKNNLKGELCVKNEKFIIEDKEYFGAKFDICLNIK